MRTQIPPERELCYIKEFVDKWSTNQSQTQKHSTDVLLPQAASLTHKPRLLMLDLLSCMPNPIKSANTSQSKVQSAKSNY